VPPAHTGCGGPAFAVATGLIVIVIVDIAAGHGPEGSLVVKVSVTVPAVISAALGVYVAFKKLAFGEKLPPPPLHDPLVALPPTIPFKLTVPPAQIVWVLPALAVATWSTVIITVEVTAGQGPAGSLVVSVSVTVPLAILGVYVDVKELRFEKVPLGADHVALVALPPIVPASVTAPPAQTV